MKVFGSALIGISVAAICACRRLPAARRSLNPRRSRLLTLQPNMMVNTTSIFCLAAGRFTPTAEIS